MTSLRPVNKIIAACLFVLPFVMADLAQAQDRTQVPTSQLFRLGEGIIRIAEPGQLVDSVNVWGDVNNPGRYVVPQGTHVHELISYARGPSVLRSTETTINWSKLRVEVNISSYDPETGQNTIENFQFRYSEPYPAELREYQVENDEIVSVELKRRAGLPDILGVVAPVISAIATTVLIFQRLD